MDRHQTQVLAVSGILGKDLESLLEQEGLPARLRRTANEIPCCNKGTCLVSVDQRFLSEVQNYLVQRGLSVTVGVPDERNPFVLQPMAAD